MPFEKSVGAVIFRREKGERKYLLLRYPSLREDYWDFPKGHIEKGESEEETLKRELQEETGIEKIKIIPGFKEWIKYFFKSNDEGIFKIVNFYLAETDEFDVKISKEHKDYTWVSFNEALDLLKYANAKKVIVKADNFLSK